MSHMTDLTGQRFGRLIVVECVTNVGDRARCYARCDCGTMVFVRYSSLICGDTKSCGCYYRERLLRHGKTRTSEYHAWRGIRARCYRSTHKQFGDYGGRGITVCDEWRESFEQFYADMGPKPSPKYSLERHNNDGPYNKENCKWATPLEQANNRRSNHPITFNGKTQTISQWARDLGMDKGKLYSRVVKLQWPIERAFTTPF